MHRITSLLLIVCMDTLAEVPRVAPAAAVLRKQDRSGRKQDRSGRKQDRDRSGRKQDRSGRKQDSGHVRRMRRRMAEAASAAATSADTAVRAAADVAAAESEELEREMAAAANAIMAAGAPGSAAAAESRTSADGSSEGVAAAVAWRTTKSCPSFAACLGDYGVCSASACAASEVVASAVSSAEAAAPVAAGTTEVAVAEVAAPLRPCWRRRFGKGRRGFVWERVEPSNSQPSSDPNPSTELDTQPTLPSREEAAAMTAEAQAAVAAISSSIVKATTAHTPAQLRAAAAELEAAAQTARAAAIGAGLAKVRAAAAHSAADAECQRLAEERHAAYEAELSLLRCHGICMTGGRAGDRCNITAAMFSLGLRQDHVGCDVSRRLRYGGKYCWYHRNQE